jgi:hypothetical protein
MVIGWSGQAMALALLALLLRLGASMVPVQPGVPQRQANTRFNAGVWRSS